MLSSNTKDALQDTIWRAASYETKLRINKRTSEQSDVFDLTIINATGSDLLTFYEILHQYEKATKDTTKEATEAKARLD